MENNMSRLECKLKEIILDSREGHMSNYSKSLREDHLHGSAFGKNAFTLDDPSSGTTIFMPWKLHSPLEATFNRMSDNSLMSPSSFKSMVDDFGLFPNFQNTRKKDDILDYILKKSSMNNGSLNFETFLLALFLLSKYRASVLHTNEQYSFNSLLNSVLNNQLNLNKEEKDYNFNLNLQKVQDENPLSRKESKTLDGVIYHDSGLIIDTNIGKVYESPRKLETKDFSDNVESTNKQTSSEFNKSGTVDTDLVKKLLEVLRDQNLINDSKILQDQLEREVKLRNELEVNYMDRLNKLESEKDELNKDYVLHKVKFGKLQVDFETLDRNFTEYKNEKENQLDQYMNENQKLSEELNEANNKLDRENFLKTRSQQIQQFLVLETEFEVKLFSIFCVYKDENCVNGEFVVTEEQLISFCVDFGLGESEPPATPDDVPKAKRAYNKVYEYSYEGKLNYLLFKEFLMNLSLLLKPELNQEEAFRYIVFHLVFSCGTNPYSDDPVNDYHPVYVTDDYDPWLPSSTNENYSPGYNQNQQKDNSKFVDVEGKLWFTDQNENNDSRGSESPSTPRFD